MLQKKMNVCFDTEFFKYPITELSFILEFNIGEALWNREIILGGGTTGYNLATILESNRENP
jgi:hypothetical protein